MHNFLNIEQKNEDEDIDQLEILIHKKKIIKNYKKKKSLKIAENIKIFFFGLLSIIFGLINIFLLFYYNNYINPFIIQINSSNYMVGNYFKCINFQKQLILNKNFDSKFTDIPKFSKDCLDNIFNFQNSLNIFEYDIANRNTTFSQYYKDIYYSNICSKINITNNCNNTLNGNLRFGIKNTQHYLFKIFKQNINDLLISKNTLTDPKVSKISKNLFESELALKNIISPALLKLTEFEIHELNSLSNLIYTILLIILVIYSIIMVLFFIFWVYPKARNLNTEIKITIKMLNMIPINVIVEIPTIRNYLIKLSR